MQSWKKARSTLAISALMASILLTGCGGEEPETAIKIASPVAGEG